MALARLDDEYDECTMCAHNNVLPQQSSGDCHAKDAVDDSHSLVVLVAIFYPENVDSMMMLHPGN